MWSTLTKRKITSWSRQNHVWILGSCSNLGHPTAMALKGGPQCHLFCSHFVSAIYIWRGSKPISTPLVILGSHQIRCHQKRDWRVLPVYTHRICLSSRKRKVYCQNFNHSKWLNTQYIVFITAISVQIHNKCKFPWVIFNICQKRK
jgi:hypothetical protein